jgi:DNA invertase Pin-like site-specific DNA recombinase
MIGFSDELRRRGVNLHVLNLDGGNLDTGTPMGSVVFTALAALAQMELAIKRDRINDSLRKQRAAGKDLGRRWQQFRHSQIQNARRQVDSGEQATRVAKDLGMSCATVYRRIREPS